MARTAIAVMPGRGHSAGAACGLASSGRESLIAASGSDWLKPRGSITSPGIDRALNRRGRISASGRSPPWISCRTQSKQGDRHAQIDRTRRRAADCRDVGLGARRSRHLQGARSPTAAEVPPVTSSAHRYGDGQCRYGDEEGVVDRHLSGPQRRAGSGAYPLRRRRRRQCRRRGQPRHQSSPARSRARAR